MSASPRSCSAPRSSARDSHGGEGRIKAARFPARKTLEEFDFTFQRSVKKTVIEHLGQLDFLHARENVILLGPPGTGKTHLAIALGDPRLPRRPARAVRDRDPMGRPARRRQTPRQPRGRAAPARRSSRCSSSTRSATSRSTPKPPTSCSALVSNRYERASMIVTSNKPFSAWGEIFGDDMAATAMIDRLIHHAEILVAQRRQLPPPRQRPRRPHRHASPPSSPDRPAGPAAATRPAATSSARRYAPSLRSQPLTPTPATSTRWATFQPAQVVHFSTGLDSLDIQSSGARVCQRIAQAHERVAIAAAHDEAGSTRGRLLPRHGAPCVTRVTFARAATAWASMS